jgi:hypothetical protein
MFDLGGMSSDACMQAAEYLGRKAAGGAAASAGAGIFNWLKEKLTGPVDKAALEKLEDNPQSEAARKMLEGAIQARLEAERSLVEDLSKLLKEGGKTLTQKIVGDNNTGIQVKGHGNTVSVDRK